MVRFRLAILLFTLMVLLPLPAPAEQPKALTVTIYNDGIALINEIRNMALPQGVQRVEFTGVPETIQAPSLQVRSATAPDQLQVLDMNYEYDLVSVKNLLDRYVGKELQVILPDPNDENSKIVRKATLLANNDAPIFRTDNKIYVGPYESVLLPSIPEGLRPRPTLVWLLDNQGPAVQDIDVSYLAEELSWRADYVLKLSRDNASGSLSGWITLNNHSGMAFDNANLKLVAGDVHRAQEAFYAREDRAVAAMAPAPKQVEEEEFFEYHLYNVNRKVDIANNQTKQISLLQAPQLGLNKQLLSEYNSYPSTDQIEIEQQVNVYLQFKNSEANGLGMPLPKGVIRAYQESQDGSTLFVGEDSIDHTPKDAELRLEVGQAFDVEVKRRLTKLNRMSSKEIRYGWQIEIRNSKDAPQALTLRDIMYGDWRIESSTHQYVQVDARHIEFQLSVPPSSVQDRMIVTYEVTTSY